MDAEILRRAYDHWFGPLPGPDYFPADKAEIWFKQSEATDRHIRDAFGPHLQQLAAAAWRLPEMTREERVGLVVFLDQFPRNIFRDSAAAFAYDARARGFARELTDHNLNGYHPIERVFLILPFEHSESLADQDHAVRLMETALASVPPGNEFYATAMDAARKHRDLIFRFGRFPHRNAVLGRNSTPEEIAFAREHGRGY